MALALHREIPVELGMAGDGGDSVRVGTLSTQVSYATVGLSSDE